MTSSITKKNSTIIKGEATWTVTWLSQGETFKTTQVTKGETLKLPLEKPTTKVDGYEFIGWTTETRVNGDGSNITYAQDGDEVSGDATYNAVFAKGTYILVSTLTEGKIYIFVSSNEGNAEKVGKTAFALDAKNMNTTISETSPAAQVKIFASGTDMIIKKLNPDLEFRYNGENDIDIVCSTTGEKLRINQAGIVKVTPDKNRKAYWDDKGLYGTDASGANKYYVWYDNLKSRAFKATPDADTGGKRVYAYEKVPSSVNYALNPNYVTITVNDCGNASFCSTIDLDFTNMTEISAYIGKDVVNGETAKLNLEGIDKVSAGTGIFVIGKPGTYAVPIYNGEEALEPRTDNSLVGTTAPYSVTESNTIYALSKNDGYLHPVKEGVTIGAGKAYYRLPENADAVSVLTLAIIDEPTGVEEIKSQSTVNGQQSTAVYNLQSMRVATPKKGEVYIMNGKKFLMK